MCLVALSTTCDICDGPLDRPFTADDVHVKRGPNPVEYYRSPLHFDCLASWPWREPYARDEFVRILHERWTDRGLVLHVSPDWFLACEVVSPRQRPPVVEVRLATWPISVVSEWTEWADHVAHGYRDGIVGPALDAVDAIMTEVREIAPSVEALAALRSAKLVNHDRDRTSGAFRALLESLWGERAHETEWWIWDSTPKPTEEDLENERRARAEETARSNEIARRLAAELAAGQALECPHCHCTSRRVRFLDPGGERRAYFICGYCSRSFAGLEVHLDSGARAAARAERPL